MFQELASATGAQAWVIASMLFFVLAFVVAVALVWRTPPAVLTAAGWVRLGTVLVVGCAGYYAIVAATRTGEVSAVVPFRYTRLIFALILGFFVFGERPDALMITGAVLIVGSGLYTVWRTALRRRLEPGPRGGSLPAP